MTGEQRQKMVTRIKKSAEEAKVAIRNIRRDANKHFDTAEKNKEMTEDERDQGKEEVQNLLKTVRGQDHRDGRQEVEGSHGAVDAAPPRPRARRASKGLLHPLLARWARSLWGAMMVAVTYRATRGLPFGRVDARRLHSER